MRRALRGERVANGFVYVCIYVRAREYGRGGAGGRREIMGIMGQSMTEC